MILRASGVLLLFLLRTSLCIPLNQFYPFGTAETDSQVAGGDDNSSPRIFLQKQFLFFGQSRSSLFVNTNGVVSFNESVRSFTPDPFPHDDDQLIAPFWADVDTTGTGTIWYRQTRSTELLSRASGEIRNAFPLQAVQHFNATDLFIATWDHVGYFRRQTGLTNTFQCVLVTDELQSFVIFYYADGEIQWTTGDHASSGGTNGLGGIPAQVGFNAGDGINFAAVPASRTPDIITIDTLTNVGIPGVWIFQVNEERIVTANVPSGPVTHLDARTVDPTTVELSWGPVTDEEQNGNITSYNIYYRPNLSNGYTVIRNVMDMEYNVTGLNVSELYIFSVTAVNQNGESNVNATTTIMTGDPIPSGPVQNVMVTNVTDDVITVMISWDPPSDPKAFIQYYRVQFKLIPDNSSGCEMAPLMSEMMNRFSNVSGTSEAPTSIVLDELVPYGSYMFSIFAATSAGEGPQHQDEFLTREATPSAASNLRVSHPRIAGNSTTLLVTWDRPSCHRGVLSGYELCYIQASSVGDCVSNGMRVTITGPDTLHYTINDLSINTNYTVEVRGRTGAGLGEPVTAMNSTDEDAPQPVMNITAEFTSLRNTSGFYNISWTVPSPDNGSFYQIFYYSFSSAYTIGPQYNGSLSVILNQSQNYYHLPDALYYTDYTFMITTINTKYNLNNGPVQIVTRTESAAPTAVRHLSATASSPESIFLSWSYPKYPNSQLSSFTIYFKEGYCLKCGRGSIKYFQSLSARENTLSRNLTGRKPYTIYTIRISAGTLIRGIGGVRFAHGPIEDEVTTRTNTSVPSDLPTYSPTLYPPRSPTNTTITVLLPPPHQICTGELYLYGVIVVPEKELSNTPVDIITSFNGQLPPPYPGRDGVYTAAVWNNTEDVPLTFVVGDEEVTESPNGTEYFNRRLSDCTSYGVFYYIRLQSDTGREDDGPLIVDDDYLSVTTTDCFTSDDDYTAVIVVAIVVFLLIILIIIGVIICIACGCTCLTCAACVSLCDRLQSKGKYNRSAEVAYAECGDVALKLPDTQHSVPSDEAVIQVLPNGGSNPEFSYNSLEEKKETESSDSL